MLGAEEGLLFGREFIEQIEQIEPIALFESVVYTFSKFSPSPEE